MNTLLRTSPVLGVGNSCNSGGDNNEDAFNFGSRELSDESVRSSGLAVGSSTPSSNSNSTTPNTEPGKQQIQLGGQEVVGSPRPHSKSSGRCGTQNTRGLSDQHTVSSGVRKRVAGTGANHSNDVGLTKSNLTTRVSNF